MPHWLTTQLTPSVCGSVPAGTASSPKLSSNVTETSCGMVLGSMQPGTLCDQGNPGPASGTQGAAPELEPLDVDPEPDPELGLPDDDPELDEPEPPEPDPELVPDPEPEPDPDP